MPIPSFLDPSTQSSMSPVDIQALLNFAAPKAQPAQAPVQPQAPTQLVARAVPTAPMGGAVPATRLPFDKNSTGSSDTQSTGNSDANTWSQTGKQSVTQGTLNKIDHKNVDSQTEINKQTDTDHDNHIRAAEDLAELQKAQGLSQFQNDQNAINGLQHGIDSLPQQTNAWIKPLMAYADSLPSFIGRSLDKTGDIEPEGFAPNGLSAKATQDLLLKYQNDLAARQIAGTNALTKYQTMAANGGYQQTGQSGTGISKQSQTVDNSQQNSTSNTNSLTNMVGEKAVDTTGNKDTQTKGEQKGFTTSPPRNASGNNQMNAADKYVMDNLTQPGKPFAQAQANLTDLQSLQDDLNNPNAVSDSTVAARIAMKIGGLKNRGAALQNFNMDKGIADRFENYATGADTGKIGEDTRQKALQAVQAAMQTAEQGKATAFKEAQRIASVLPNAHDPAAYAPLEAPPARAIPQAPSPQGVDMDALRARAKTNLFSSDPQKQKDAQAFLSKYPGGN